MTYSVSEHNAKPTPHRGHYNVITVIRRCFSCAAENKHTARLMFWTGCDCSDHSSLVGWSGPSQWVKGVGHRSHYVYRMAALTFQLQHCVGNIHCTDGEPIIDRTTNVITFVSLIVFSQRLASIKSTLIQRRHVESTLIKGWPMLWMLCACLTMITVLNYVHIVRGYTLSLT